MENTPVGVPTTQPITPVEGGKKKRKYKPLSEEEKAKRRERAKELVKKKAEKIKKKKEAEKTQVTYKDFAELIPKLASDASSIESEDEDIPVEETPTVSSIPTSKTKGSSKPKETAIKDDGIKIKKPEVLQEKEEKKKEEPPKIRTKQDIMQEVARQYILQHNGKIY
jgi:hypothetical protein